MTKKLIFLFLFFLSMLVFGQEIDNYTLEVIKHNQGTVTDLIINENSNELFSADSKGNILVYSSKDYKYLKSLNLDASDKINKIRLVNNNEDLLINYYNLSYKDGKQLVHKKGGNLCLYSLKKDTIYKTFKGNYKITNPNGEALIAIAKNDVNLILYDTTSFKKIDSIATKNPVLTSTISFDNKLIATIEDANNSTDNEGFKEIKALTIYEIGLHKSIYNLDFKNPKKMLAAILFEKKSLLYLSSNPQKKHSEFTRIHIKDFSVENLGSNDFYTDVANTNILSNNREKLLVFNDAYNPSYQKEYNNKVIIADLKDDFYTLKTANCSLKNNIGIYNDLKKQYILVAAKEQYQFEPTISIHDAKFNLIEKELVQIKDHLNAQSFFIANDYWASYILNSSKDIVFNLYEEGSLVNKFFKDRTLIDKFSYKTNSFLESPSYSFKEELFDKNNGAIGSRKYQYQQEKDDYRKNIIGFHYFRYNLLTNNEEKLYSSSPTEINHLKSDLVAFNGEQNIFLTSVYKDDKNGTQFIVISEGKEYLVGKPRLFGIEKSDVKFSNSGKYICLKTDKNTYEIYDWKKNKLIYTYKGDYVYEIIHPVDQNNFIITKSNPKNKGSENKISHLLSERNNMFEISKLNNHYIYDADFKNDKLALLIKGGIIFENAFQSLPNLQEAQTISLNSDASKLLVNFADGTTRLLDTSTFKWLNTIFNFPDNKTLIYNTKGKYYSNSQDIKDYLFVRKNNIRVSILEDSLKLYDPVSILADFGKLETEMKDKIEEALKFRQNSKKENLKITDVIKDFYLENSLKANQLTYPIIIELKQDVKYNFKVKINNVLQNNLKIKKVAPFKFKTEISLSQKVNRVEISCFNKKLNSLPLTKEINYNFEIPRDLYILSVGVSDYQNKDFTLKYAHKDAIDMSLLYDTLKTENVKKYLNNIYPAKILKKSISNKVQELNTNIPSSYLFKNGNPFQISKDGNYWLLPSKSDEITDYTRATNVLKLYDFKNNTVNKIELLGDVFERHFKTDKDNLGFYYYNLDDDEAYEEGTSVNYYNFKSNKSEQTDITFNVHKAYQIDKFSWLSLNENNIFKYQDGSLADYYTEENMLLSFIKYTKKNNIWIVKKYPLKVKNKRKNSRYNIADVSSDGNFVGILEDYTFPDPNYPQFEISEQLFRLFQLKNDKYVEVKLNSELNGFKYVFSKDSKNLHVLEGEEYDYEKYDVTLETFSIYNLSKKKLIKEKTNIKVENDAKILGFNYGVPFTLDTSNSGLTDIEYSYFEKIIDDLNFFYNTPISYKKTHVKTLTNKEATARNIINAATNFFKQAKPEDQIIFFLAGHGVLDKKLNYYYAPQDMVFNQPEKKGVSYNTIVNILSKSSAKKKLLITDTCHSGNTFDINNYDIEQEKEGTGQRGTIVKKLLKKNGNITTSSIITSVLDNFYSNSGVTVLSASSGQEVAYESNDINNGAFTRAYLETIKNPIENQTFSNKYFDTFLKKLEKKLLIITDNKQKMDLREINNLADILLW